MLVGVLALSLAAGNVILDAPKSCRDPATGHSMKCPRAAAPKAKRASAKTAVVKALAPGVAPTMAGAPRCKDDKPCKGAPRD